MVELCSTVAHPKKSPIQRMFHRPPLHVLGPFPTFCSTPPPAQTSPPSTGIRIYTSATPRGGCPLCRTEHKSNNITSMRNSFIADYNDLTTTVAASETTNTKEVVQLNSPLFSDEREVTSNPFAVSGSQQKAVASGSERWPANVINHWQSLDLWRIFGKLVRGCQVLKDPCREEKGIEISKVCRFCPIEETSTPTLRRKLN